MKVHVWMGTPAELETARLDELEWDEIDLEPSVGPVIALGWKTPDYPGLYLLARLSSERAVLFRVHQEA